MWYKGWLLWLTWERFPEIPHTTAHQLLPPSWTFPGEFSAQWVRDRHFTAVTRFIQIVTLMKVGQSPHTSHKMWAFSPILHNRGTIIVFILRPHYGSYNNVCNLPSTSFLEQSEWIPSLTQGTTGFAGFCFSTDASSSPWDSAFWEQEMQMFKRAPSDQMIRSEILAQSTFSRCIASDCTPFPSSFVLGQPKAVGTRQVWGGCFCGAFLTLSNVTSPSQYLQLYLQTHSQKPGGGEQSGNQSPSVARELPQD